MTPTHIRIKPKITHEQFGTSITYFKKFIKRKDLKIVLDRRIFVVIIDSNNEEWTVYNDSFVVSKFDPL
jgi:hypothetical protein